MADPLFSVRNNFYIGAYQKAVSEASQLTGLTEQQKIERDVFVYRSYIELGSYEVRAAIWAGVQVAQGPQRRWACSAEAGARPWCRIRMPCGRPARGRNCAPPAACPQLVLAEISGSSPIALQAVKQLALYMKEPGRREAVLEQVTGWLTDMTYTGNATVLLVAGLVFLLEENYVEALKCCHSGLSLEM